MRRAFGRWLKSVDSGKVKTVVAKIPYRDTYIYCQNEPGYTNHAAFAAFVAMKIDTGQAKPGFLQFGWQKSRKEGTTDIQPKVYIEIYDGVGPADPSNPDHYYLNTFADPPSPNGEYKIVRDCDTGAFQFLLDGVPITPAGLSPTLEATMSNENNTPTGGKIAVELHDIRSRAPGTVGNEFRIFDARYQKCGSILWPAMAIVKEDPGIVPELNIISDGVDLMEIWDTRNP